MLVAQAALEELGLETAIFHSGGAIAVQAGQPARARVRPPAIAPAGARGQNKLRN